MMPKIANETRADKLRRLTSGTKRRAVDVRDVYDDFTEDVDQMREATDAIEQADLSSAASTLSELAEALEPLVGKGLIDREMVDEMTTTASWLGTITEDAELLEPSRFVAFVEAYDALQEALDVYDGYKESDRYEGRSDDLESSWDEVVANAETLADAADDLSLDAEPATDA